MKTVNEKVHVVLAAGGSGTRMNAGDNKIFLDAGGKSVLLRSMHLFDGLIDRMVIVCRPEDELRIRNIISGSGVSYNVCTVSGGDTRQHSVLNGLKSLDAGPDDIVLIHDAARCMTPRDVILRVLDSCDKSGSGVAAIPAVNTMKYADSGMNVVSTADRKNLYEVQTPQGFCYGLLLRSYMKAENDGFTATDDASVVEYAGDRVLLVDGSIRNIKVTEKEDLVMINALLHQDIPPYRIGMGYDVHRLTEGRKLILCGIEIPHSLGLLGHSDADVALHALMDAMLGAAALGDIGRHFPDTSDEYKGISSLLLLKEVIRMIRNAGYEFVNADITIAAQKPKLAPCIPDMILKVSTALSCDPGQINIKATTTEKLGFEGREEGISAQAVCFLRKI